VLAGARSTGVYVNHHTMMASNLLVLVTAKVRCVDSTMALHLAFLATGETMSETLTFQGAHKGD
jgi:hypothetical protein